MVKGASATRAERGQTKGARRAEPGSVTGLSIARYLTDFDGPAVHFCSMSLAPGNRSKSGRCSPRGRRSPSLAAARRAFVVEDIKCRQADIRNFLIREVDFVAHADASCQHVGGLPPDRCRRCRARQR